MSARANGGRIPEWPPNQADVITAELVACTLGARQRIELRIDPIGVIYRTRLRLLEQLASMRELSVISVASARAAAGIRTGLDRIRREDTQP